MNLKEVAKARGTNLKKIAEKCNVPPSTLYAISSGDTNFENVGIGLFMKIADALGMTSEELYSTFNEVHYAVVEMSDDLEIEEVELIDHYRRMGEEQKKEVRNLAKMLYAVTIFNEGGHEAAQEHGFDFVPVERGEGDES